MVNLKDNLRFQNVVSKEYYADYKDAGKCLNMFIDELKEYGVRLRGPIFYGLHSYSDEGEVKMEMFTPVYTTKIVPPGMNFHTYYSVEHMASARVTSNFENNTMPTMEMVIRTIEAIGGRIASPIYFIREDVLGEPYITIKIGYIKESEYSGII
ncbi:MAG: DUF5085 family protein [Lachnospiraceae bacterium]|nr:DUF5085 family protein [Lachnospiraceae bacterium]